MPKPICSLTLLLAGRRPGPAGPGGVLRPGRRGRRQQAAAGLHRQRDQRAAIHRAHGGLGRLAADRDRATGPGSRPRWPAASSTAGRTGSNTDLGTLRTGTLHLGLEGPIIGAAALARRLGGITYWPAEQEGIFPQGGTTRFLAGAGVDYRRPVLPKWDLMASARYDYHRFTTDELEARGFSQTQGVGRVSLSVGLARGLR